MVVRGSAVQNYYRYPLRCRVYHYRRFSIFRHSLRVFD